MAYRSVESANANVAMFGVYMRRHSPKRVSLQRQQEAGCPDQKQVPPTRGEGALRTSQTVARYHPYTLEAQSLVAFTAQPPITSRTKAASQHNIIQTRLDKNSMLPLVYEDREGSSRESSPPALTEASTDASDSWSDASMDGNTNGGETVDDMDMQAAITRMADGGVWMTSSSGLRYSTAAEDADKMFEMYINVDECGDR